MNESPADVRDVSAILAQRVRELSEKIQSTNGNLAPDDIAKLTLLAQIVDLREKTSLPRIRPRWPIAALCVVTFSIVGLLLFGRVATTSIELDVVVSEVGFAVSAPMYISGIADVSELGIVGATEIELPPQLVEAGRIQADTGRGLAVRLQKGELETGRSASISLAPIDLAGDSEVRITKSDVARRYRISLSQGSGDLEVTPVVLGSVVTTIQKALAPRDVSYEVPTSISARSHGFLSVDLTFPSGPEMLFAAELPTKSLTLSKLEVNGATGERQRSLSAIESGDLYLMDLKGEVVAVRPGEMIRFQSSDGVVRRVELRDDGIHLRFSGQVRGMTFGGDEAAFTMMPTYLEWLQANQALSLFWGAGLYVVTTAIGVARWWRNPE